MTRSVVLVRGVNVGGRNKLPMAQFRSLLAGLGGTEVKTYLQSGNAVLFCPDSAAQLERRVAAALTEQLQLSVAVMVRSPNELGKVIAANPFQVRDPKHFHVGFLAGEPDAERLAAIDPAALLPDRFALGPRAVYLDYADVSQNTKLSRLKLGVEMTARNWRTVLALHELATP